MAHAVGHYSPDVMCGYIRNSVGSGIAYPREKGIPEPDWRDEQKLCPALLFYMPAVTLIDPVAVRDAAAPKRNDAMNHFEQVIDRYRQQSHSEADKGHRFERLMQAMLRTLPPWSKEIKSYNRGHGSVQDDSMKNYIHRHVSMWFWIVSLVIFIMLIVGYIVLKQAGGHVVPAQVNCREDKRPYRRVTYWQQEVNCANPIATSYEGEGIDTYTAQSIYTDNCVLYLPESYKPQGTPTKLIIFCKEGDSQVGTSSDPIFDEQRCGRLFHWLLYLGYAVVAADGVPDAWKAAIGATERAVGNYVAVQSTIKAVEYVGKHYNVDTGRLFVFGYSQGGHYAQNVIDNSALNVAAVAEWSPVCSMRWHQWDLSSNATVGGVTFTKAARLNIARMFGFPAVSTNIQLLNLDYDPDLTMGYDPWTRNVEDPYNDFVKQEGSDFLYRLPDGVTVDQITMKKYSKAPLKIWAAEDDNKLSADVFKVFIKAMRNTGQIAELKLYNQGEHHVQQYQTAVGTFVENGETCDLYPIALDVALWFYNFGGYPLKDYNLSE